TQRLDAMPQTLFKEIDRDVRELYTRSGAVRDEIFSKRCQFRCLEHKQKRIATALQREMKEMRDRVTVLEQERDRRERFPDES
nr:hypothetical protein [Tanacetum cinerariifolium]